MTVVEMIRKQKEVKTRREEVQSKGGARAARKLGPPRQKPTSARCSSQATSRFPFVLNSPTFKMNRLPRQRLGPLEINMAYSKNH